MSTLLEEMTYGLRQLIGRQGATIGDPGQGATITYRQRTTLPGANPAPNPPTYVNLVTAGAAIAGAAVISLRAGIVTGRLIPGDTINLPGHVLAYTVQAQVISPTTANTLSSISIDPPLQYDTPDGTAVSLSFAADTVLKASVTDYPDRLINGTTIMQKDHRIRFVASDLPVEPTIGDQVIMPDGEIQEVINTAHLEIQGSHYGWSLQVRA